MANNILIDKERKSPSGRLQVKPSNPDRFLQEPRFLSPPATSPNWIDKNGNVTLECLVTGHPATSLRWSVNRTTPAGLVSQRGYLMVSTPGNYTCTAVGRSGVFLERTFQVQEALSANIIRRPKSQVFPTARTVRFECEVSGWPIPEIQWLKVTFIDTNKGDTRPIQPSSIYSQKRDQNVARILFFFLRIYFIIFHIFINPSKTSRFSLSIP